MRNLTELAGYTPEELAERQQATLAANTLPNPELDQDQSLSAREHLSDIRDILGRRLNDEAVAAEFNGLVDAYKAGVATTISGVKLHAKETVGNDTTELTNTKDRAFGSRLNPMDVRGAVKSIVLGDVLSSIGVPTEALDKNKTGPTSELAQNIVPVVERVIRVKVSGKAQDARQAYENESQKPFAIDETTGFSNQNIAAQVIPEIDRQLDPLFRALASDISLLKKSETTQPAEDGRQERNVGGFAVKAAGIFGRHREPSLTEQNKDLKNLLRTATEMLSRQSSNTTAAMGKSLASKLLNEADYATVRDANKTNLESAINDFYTEILTKEFVDFVDQKVAASKPFYDLKKYVFAHSGKEVPPYAGDDRDGYETDASQINERIQTTLEREIDDAVDAIRREHPGIKNSTVKRMLVKKYYRGEENMSERAKEAMTYLNTKLPQNSGVKQEYR